MTIKIEDDDASAVAQFLEKQGSVKRVLHVGKVVSFELCGQSFTKAKCFVDTVRRYSSIIYGEGASGLDTVLAYRPSLGSSFKLSIGLEDIEDMLGGLRQGLEALSGA